MPNETLESIVEEAIEKLSEIFKGKVDFQMHTKFDWLTMVEGYVGVCRNGDPVLFGTQKRVHFYNDGRCCKANLVYDGNLVSKVDPQYDIVKIINTRVKNLDCELVPHVIWSGNEVPAKLKLTRKQLQDIVGRDFEIVD